MKKIIIITGGTGGHVLPALSIYDHLKDSFDVILITDSRGSKFINEKNYPFNLIEVPNLFSRLYLLPINLIKFLFSIFRSYFFLKKQNISYLISTGGYMSLPFCIASKFLKIKIFLFEPNSVLGRANKYMLKLSKKIICYDSNVKNLPQKYQNKIYITNPILRKEIYLQKKNQNKYPSDIKKIVVIGGSQGAKFFDRNITNLILKISETFKIEVSQQVFDKNEQLVIEQKYNNAFIKNKLFSFDEKLYQNLGNFDFAITRSGASAISELAFFNIPFLAIPFPFARDQHQFFNAKFYESKDCCWLIKQENFNIDLVNDLIVNLLKEKNDYLKKKENLEKISNQNTWNIVNKKLFDLINEN